MNGRAGIFVALAVGGIACTPRTAPKDAPPGSGLPDAAHASATRPAAPPDASVADANAPDASVAAVAAPVRCGGERCKPDEFCEERYKGHAVDDEGRPLDQRKCMPLPKPCKKDPTCTCVTRHVQTTGCTENGGQISTTDDPHLRRRR